MIAEISGNMHTSGGGKGYESYDFTIRRRSDAWEWLVVNNYGGKDFRHGVAETIEVAFLEIGKTVLELHAVQEVGP